MTPSQVAQCDIALMNLLCAEGLPGAENLSPQECIARLDAWTERVRSETERHIYRYQANPREFESSEGYFRMLMMAVVVYEDFFVRYNPERISTPDAVDANDHFFADSRDVFLHGLLGRHSNSPSPYPLPKERWGSPNAEVRRPNAEVQGLKANMQSRNFPSPYPLPEERVAGPARPLGTCSSMPVLYVAIGRRLGYPLKLATTKAHVFLRWEGAGERFDLEATGKGMNRYDDEHFKQWPFPVAEAEIQADGYLKSLTPAEELALFLSLRGHCLKEAGRLSEAVASYAEAVRLAPGCRPYRFLLAAAPQERAHPVSGAGVPPVSGGPARVRPNQAHASSYSGCFALSCRFPAAKRLGSGSSGRSRHIPRGSQPATLTTQPASRPQSATEDSSAIDPTRKEDHEPNPKETDSHADTPALHPSFAPDCLRLLRSRFAEMGSQGPST